MAQTVKTPPLKQTVGALYIAFDEGTGYTGVFDEEVIKSEVVKSISVSEATESTPVNASGKVYATMTQVASADMSVEVVAFDAKTRATMRGDTTTTAGLLLKGKSGERPYFAFGKVVKFTDDKVVYEWFPKCQLTSNTDEAKTKESSFSEQNETLTITALPFDNDGNICVAYDSTICTTAITEAEFFAKPILSDADLPTGN